VRLQFRNFPLAFHPQAAPRMKPPSRRARRTVRNSSPTRSTTRTDCASRTIALAGRLGLDADAFAATIRSHRYAPRVQADVAAGARKGIRGSPVILVNGRRIDGVPSVNTLIEYVETALETSTPVQ
jgi:hypothetical protein